MNLKSELYNCSCFWEPKKYLLALTQIIKNNQQK